MSKIKIILLLLVTTLSCACLYGQAVIGGKTVIGGKVVMGSTAASCTSTTCGGMTFKQGCNGVNSATTVTCVFGSNLTAGSVIFVSGGNANTATMTFSGCGLTWTNQHPLSGVSPSWGQATAPNAGTGACTITMTSTVSAFISIDAVELAGSSSQTIDVSSQVETGSIAAGTNISGTSITTTTPNDVVVQVVSGFSTTGDVYSSPSGAIIYQGTANGIGFGFQWQLQASAGAVSPTIKSSATDFFIVGNLAIEP